MKNQWCIKNKEDNIVVDYLSHIEDSSEVVGKSLEGISFLVNKNGYVCELYLEKDQIKTKDISDEFKLVREDGKNNINDGLKLVVYNSSNEKVDTKELKSELDVVQFNEIYELIVEDGELSSNFLEGWRAEYI